MSPVYFNILKEPLLIQNQITVAIEKIITLKNTRAWVSMVFTQTVSTAIEKKIKSWEPFWSYQLNSTANLAKF